ncbi:MAG: hypothetical protein V3V92_04880 [Candidatus Hydrothermarchaeales archaeon]
MAKRNDTKFEMSFIPATVKKWTEMSKEKNLLVLFSIYLLAMGFVAVDMGVIEIPTNIGEISIRPVVPVSIEALNERPQNYLGKEVRTTGTLRMSEEIRAGPNVMYLEDAKGRSLDVILQGIFRDGQWRISKGNLIPGQAVSIVGVLTSHEICSCQVGLPGEAWADTFTRVGYVEDCLTGKLMSYGENVEYRCAPGTVKQTNCLIPEENT